MSAGWRIGPYQLVRRFSVEGWGEKWQATGDREVLVMLVVPVLCEDEDFRDGVLECIEEQRAISDVRVPQVLDAFEAIHPNGEPTLAIVFEYVPGISVRRLLRTVKHFPPYIGARIVQRFARLVAEVDLPPHSILRAYDLLSSIIIDDHGALHFYVPFVPASWERPDPTRTGVLKGRFAYLSPEAAMGEELTAPSTVFTLGIVMYQLITGSRPFDRKTDLETLESIRTASYQPLSELAPVTRELAAVLDRALSRSPRKRYEDPGKLADAIDAVLPAEIADGAIRDLALTHREAETEPDLPASADASPLLDAIRENPDDPEPYLVYADELQSQGDPRGELIVLSHQELLREQDNFIARHPELLGSLAPFFHDATLNADWYLGFIRTLRIRFDSSDVLPQIFTAIEHEHSTRFLRHLQIGPHRQLINEIDRAYRILSNTRLHLTTLFAGDFAERAHTDHHEVHRLCQSLPMLERLHLRGARFDLQPLSFPELRELRIEARPLSNELRKAIDRSNLPKLEKLDLLEI